MAQVTGEVTVGMTTTGESTPLMATGSVEGAPNVLSRHRQSTL